MSSKRLPIAGYPHLALAAQNDAALFARTTAELRKVGFNIGADGIVPPDGFDGRQIIAAISIAFQNARTR